jgi:hypothetical protein
MISSDRWHIIEDYIDRRDIPLKRLRSVFPLGSEARRLIDELLARLAMAALGPSDDYEQWGLSRIAKTIEILRKWLHAGTIVMDIASGAHFSFLVAGSLPRVDWLPTDVADEPVEFRDVADGSLVYTYRPRRFMLDEGRLTIPHDGLLDAVTLFEVVEHLPWNPSSLFGSINEGLKSGGLLIISTPNSCSRSAILRLLRGGSPHQTPLLEVGLWYHRKEYSPWELRQLLEWAGFEVEGAITSNCYLDDPRDWRAMVHHACLLIAAGLSLSAVEARNLIKYQGSTQFLLARKVGECDWSRPKIKV